MNQGREKWACGDLLGPPENLSGRIHKNTVPEGVLVDENNVVWDSVL
jgi:hypothetical protein